MKTSDVSKLPRDAKHGKPLQEDVLREAGKMYRIITYEDGFQKKLKYIGHAGHSQEHDDHSLKQHVGVNRKLALRKNVLARARLNLKDAGIYVPFCGDGDISSQLYRGGNIFASDLEKARCQTFLQNIPEATVVQGDCDFFPFKNVAQEFSLADFDAYSFPYRAFHSFWQNANKAPKMVMFFTDGHKQSIIRSHWWHHPDGVTKEYVEKLVDQRRIFHTYWAKNIEPWFKKFMDENGYKTVFTMQYPERQSLYWGAYVERKKR